MTKTGKVKEHAMTRLLGDIRVCEICKNLPLGPQPIVQASARSKILIAGQAPGQITHKKAIPFDDPSGKRLRQWLGVDREQFYDPDKFAIVPMGFCYPGKGNGGDLPPRSECAQNWHLELFGHLNSIELKLVIGQYALDWHLGNKKGKTLTETVLNWQQFWPQLLPLPHPSPRNIRWFKNNAWFEEDVLPELRKRVAELLGK